MSESVKYLPVVIAGGVGSRLWPASRAQYPKQFLDLLDEGAPLLVSTLKRNLENPEFGRVVTTADQEGLSRVFMGRHGFGNTPILAEPVGKSTAPAVMLAALEAKRHYAEEVVLGVFPADHAIRNPKLYQNLVQRAVGLAAEGRVVTLGIEPHNPSTAYGYIQTQPQPKSDFYDVDSFLEKPDEAKAKKLLKAGNVYWNAGIFFFKASTILDLFEKHQPEIFKTLSSLKDDHSNIAELYSKLPNISIDYAIMEKIQSEIACIPADIGWSDVGSWEDVARLNAEAQDSIHQEAGQGNAYWSTGVEAKKVISLGVDDVTVVETPDALMLVKNGYGQKVRDIYKFLEGANSPLSQVHTFEDRPWGSFEVLRDTEYFKSKKITVLPGQRLSYQSHKHRAEHWVVVKGIAEVTLNDEVHRLKTGENIYIPLGAKHRIANPTSEPMEFIEVQIGDYFGEDDIVRYSDDYSRS